MGVTMGAAAVRMVMKGLYGDIGDLSFGAFIAVLGVSVGTATTLLVYLTPEIVLFFKRQRVNNGSEDFIAGRGGFYWLGDFYNLDPTNTSCCVGVSTLEDRRVNFYNQGKAPCIEFCFSTVTKNGANYFFHRIPIPPTRIEEAQAYVNSSLAQPGRDSAVWAAHLTGYARDLEGPVV